MTCPSCGESVPTGARFCPACGHALVVRADERRVVSVLFADLVGFTALSEGRDPEQVKALVDRCLQRVVADVVAFGGLVDKIVGDGVLALFGAPVAHEDDAERAVRAGMRLHETVAAFSAEEDVSVQLRVGVNTGEVLVGALRAGDDYTAMGDVVNTAQRLQAHARPGEVRVGASTYALTRLAIGYDDHRVVELKGKDDPVDTWRAVAALMPPGRRPSRQTTPLVGRTAELSLLASAIQLATRNARPQLVLLEGDAGVGKSRLASEAATVAVRAYDALLLGGRCAPYGEANVWLPLATALDGVLALSTAEPDEEAELARRRVAEVLELPGDHTEVARVADGLRFLVLGRGPLEAIDADRARRELTRSLVVFMAALARRRPVILALSDLHWADKQVLDLVEVLLQRVLTSPLVVLGTRRLSSGDDWQPMPAGTSVLRILVEPLPAEEAATMLDHLTEGALDPERRQLLLDRGGGNPFFLEELASLVRTGDGGAGTDLLGAGTSTPLPGTLRGLILARLDSLPPDERVIVDNAAVLGSSGATAALAKFAAALGQDASPALLESLVAKGIFELDSIWWRFRSDSVREVAYHTLTKTVRAHRHWGVGRAIEAWASGRDDQVEAIAQHYATAVELAVEMGDVRALGEDALDRAVQWAERAARRAQVQWGGAIAERWATRAVNLATGRVPDATMRRLQLVRAGARGALHHYHEARADLHEVIVTAERDGDGASIAEAITRLGELASMERRPDEALSLMAQALERWHELGDEAGEAEALRVTGMVQVFAGLFDPADETLHRARVLFTRLGDRRGAAWADQNLAWVAFMRGDLDLADERIHAAATTFAELGDVGGMGWALGLLGWVRFIQGRLDEAERLAVDIGKEANERGETWANGMMQVLLANIRLWRGRLVEAVELARLAIGAFVEIEDPWGLMQAHGPLGRALTALGHEEAAAAAFAACEETGDPSTAAAGWMAMIGAAVHAGRPHAALAIAEEHALPSANAVFGNHDWWVSLALAHVQLGHVREAEEALERASTPGLTAYRSCAASMIAAAGGRPLDALAAADVVLGEAEPTYLDRFRALIGQWGAYVQLGRSADADAAIAAAEAVAGAVEDVFLPGVVALMRRISAGDAPTDPEPGWPLSIALVAGLMPAVPVAAP